MDADQRGRRATSLLSRGRPPVGEPAPPATIARPAVDPAVPAATPVAEPAADHAVDVTPAQPPAAAPGAPTRRGAGRPRRRLPTRRGVWAGAALAVLLLAAAGGLAAWGMLQLDHARKAQQWADLGLAITADPAARRSTATVASGGSVTATVSGDRAALVVRDLLMLDAQHTYQVWLVRGDLVTPVGVGPPGGAAGGPWVRVITAVQPGDTIAISEEPAQGSTRPTGRPIAAVKI